MKIREVLCPKNKKREFHWRHLQNNTVVKENSTEGPIDESDEELSDEPVEEEPENPEFHQMKKELEDSWKTAEQMEMGLPPLLR